jgi:hypothetical protein
MSLVVKDRVRETTITSGTGPVTLLGAVVGYQSFAAIGNANSTYYCIADQGGANWEVGIGTYMASGTTLSRDTVLASSNAGALVNFGVGVTKDVFVTQPTERTVLVDDLNFVRGSNGAEGGKALLINAQTVTANVVVASGYNALSVGPLAIASGVTVTLASGSRQLIL